MTGLSILIRKSLSFTSLDLHLDPEGKCVIMHAVNDNVPMVVVGLYIPLPATNASLMRLTQMLAKYY